MKKISLILIALLAFPALIFSQYKVKAVHQEPTDLKVTIPAYNDRIPAAVMNVRFEFDQETETLLVRMSKGTTKCEYDKIWLPQHDVTVSDMKSYMRSRGVKLRKAKTFEDQENFLNLSSKTLLSSIHCTGMTFSGTYDMSKKMKRELDRQMVPLDGKAELDLSFKTDKKSRKAVLVLRNPIPMNRHWRKGTVAYVANDVTITVELGRCKDAEQNIQTIEEYEAMFAVAENKLIELKKSPSTQKAYKDFILNMYREIDLSRFEMMGCDDIQDSYENLTACIERINKMGVRDSNNNNNNNNGKDNPDPTPKCDVNALNNEIKATTAKLNNMVNDWSLASDAASKAEKKAAFDAAVQRFDAKLNDLPAGCKGKLDAKLLKNYEFVKKLVK